MPGRKNRLLVFLIIYLAMTPLLYSATTYGGSDLNQQGVAFLKAQRFDEAINVFSNVLKTDPDNAKSAYYRGMARYYKGNIDKAIEDYSRALEKDPDLANVHTSRGVAYFRKGDYRQARKDLDIALDKNPDDANAINQKAWLLAACPDSSYRDGKEALQMARKAINLKTTPNYLDTLAAAYAENGQYEEAARIQRKVIALLTQKERLSRLNIYLERLKKYEAGEPWREGEAPTAKPEPKTTGEKTPEPVKSEPKKAQPVQQKAVKQEDPKKAAIITETPASPTPKKTAAIAAAPVTTLPKPAEKKTQTLSQPKTIISPNNPGNYPYTIFISAYQDPNITSSKVLNLKKNGDPAFISHAYFKESGHWYQVYFGWYKNAAEAYAAAEKLKQRQFFKSIVVKKPYTVQAGKFSSKKKIKKLETDLAALNYPAYRIPDTTNPKKIRLLIGAYSTAAVPDKLIETLKAAGFKPKIVRR